MLQCRWCICISQLDAPLRQVIVENRPKKNVSILPWISTHFLRGTHSSTFCDHIISLVIPTTWPPNSVSKQLFTSNSCHYVRNMFTRHLFSGRLMFVGNLLLIFSSIFLVKITGGSGMFRMGRAVEIKGRIVLFWSGGGSLMFVDYYDILWLSKVEGWVPQKQGQNEGGDKIRMLDIRTGWLEWNLCHTCTKRVGHYQ